MKKSLKIALSFLIVLNVVIACKDVEDSESMLLEEVSAPAKTVFAEPVKVVNLQETVRSSGKLIKKVVEKLSFKKGGQIEKIYVRAGEKVKKGQKLAMIKAERIDMAVQPTDLTNKVDLPIKEIALQDAEKEYEEIQILYSKHAASVDQLEKAKSTVEKLKEQLVAAKASTKTNQQRKSAIQANQAYTIIKAPADGIIVERYVGNRETIKDNAPVVLFNETEAAPILKVDFASNAAKHLQRGDKAIIHFDERPDETFKGQVVQVAPQADPTLNTVEVDIKILSDKELEDGMTAKVAITTQEGRPLISIPIQALASQEGIKGKVFILEDRDVMATEVIIFKVEGDRVLVKSGLENGEQVIITGDGYIQQEETILTK